MTKHFTLKRLLIGLLLFCSVFAYASFNKASAGGMDDMLMETFCDSWQENMRDYSGQDNCWSCQIFMLFFDAANATAAKINNALSGPVGKVIIIGVALFVVFNALVFFSSVNDAPNIMEFLTKVGGIILKAGFAYCFLKGGAKLAFDYIVNPVLASAANLATQILDSMDTNSVPCSMSGDTNGSVGAPIGEGVRSSLECMIKKIASGMARSQSIAQGLRCGAFFWWRLGGWPLPFEFYIPNPLMWLVGMILGCLFWLISCLFPIAMLDVIFRIGLTVGMLPLFIAAWIFPITQKYAKTAWDIFLHSCLVFAITGVMVCMVVAMVENAWVAGDSSLLQDFQRKMEASSYVDAWDEALFAGGIGSGLANIFIVMSVGVWGLYTAPLADKVSGKFIGAADFPESCGIRAIRGTINFIMDVIMFIITIISWGATASLYVLKTMKHVADGLKKIEDLKKMIDKVRKFREKMQKIQRVANKVRSGAQVASNVATGNKG